MLSWSERSFQLWPSLELRLLFAFSALAVLPRLLSLLASHVFVPAAACVLSLDKVDCVVSLDVVSWLGTAAVAVNAVSGSSGGLIRTLGIGPIRMGSRSLRTFNGLPHVTGVGLTGSTSWRSREWCPNVALPLCVSMHGFEPCHSVFRSGAHLFCCHV